MLKRNYPLLKNKNIHIVRYNNCIFDKYNELVRDVNFQNY